MKRAVLTFVIAVGLVLGSSVHVNALGETQVQLDCGDGDSWTLAVDVATLASLTETVQAMLEYPAGLTCTLTRLPTPLVTLGSPAMAASGSGYVLGSGQVVVQGGCPNDPARTFVGNFAVKMQNTASGVTGSGYLKVGGGQCVGPSTLNSTATCLAIFPVGLAGYRAWANSFVTSTSGAYFATQNAKTIGWGFEDHGNKGSATPDRFRVEERPSSCPLFGDPNQNFFDLSKGSITVRP
jgi:hypothetical protein